MDGRAGPNYRVLGRGCVVTKTDPRAGFGLWESSLGWTVCASCSNGCLASDRFFCLSFAPGDICGLGTTYLAGVSWPGGRKEGGCPCLPPCQYPLPSLARTSISVLPTWGPQSWFEVTEVRQQTYSLPTQRSSVRWRSWPTQPVDVLPPLGLLSAKWRPVPLHRGRGGSRLRQRRLFWLDSCQTLRLQ